MALKICPDKTLRQTALLAVAGVICLGTAFAQEKLILPSDSDTVERPGQRPDSSLLDRGFNSLNKRSSVGGLVELPSVAPSLSPTSRSKADRGFDLFGKESNWIYNNFGGDEANATESALGVTWLSSSEPGENSVFGSSAEDSLFGQKEKKNSRTSNRDRYQETSWQNGEDDAFTSSFDQNSRSIFGFGREDNDSNKPGQDSVESLFGSKLADQNSPFRSSFEETNPFTERTPSSVSGVFNNSQNLFTVEGKALREKELLKKSDFQKLLNPNSSLAPVATTFDPLGSLQFDGGRQTINPVTSKSTEQLTMPKANDPWEAWRQSHALRPTTKPSAFEDFASRNALPGGSTPAFVTPASTILVRPQTGNLDWPKIPR